MQISRPIRKLVLVLFVVACYFPLFLHLDSEPLRLWDESRRGVNALEMMENGQWLVPHYNGEPDMWGTKPPLLVWMQAACMFMLGPGELAVRLPSALAACATLGLMIWFFRRFFQHLPWGLLAGLILVTTPGYVGIHGARTGDFDALLTFWLTGYLLFFFAFLQNRDRIWWWYLTVTFATLAVLTKGIAGLFFAPGLLLFAVIQKQFLPLLRSRHTYTGLAAFLLPVVAYYLFREWANTGYLKTVWGNEIGGRYFQTLEQHDFPFFHYFVRLPDRFSYWGLFLPLGILFGLAGEPRRRRLTAYLALNAILFLLVISMSKTKLSWYDLPVFPLLSMLSAVTLVKGATFLFRTGEKLHPVLRRSWTALFLLFLFFYPYSNMIRRAYDPARHPENWEKEQYGNFIKGHPDLKRYYIAKSDYNSHVDFYTAVFNRQGYELTTKYPGDRFEVGDLLLLCEERHKERFRRDHDYEPVRYWDRCELVRVTGYRGGR